MKTLLAGTLLSGVLLYIADKIILYFFADVANIKSAVGILSFSIFPTMIIFVTKALDYMKDFSRKPAKLKPLAKTNGVKKETPAVPNIKKEESVLKPYTVIPSGYANPKDDPYYVSSDHFSRDPDYQDYLQGNIRPSRYQIEHKVADNGEEYTTLKSDRTVMSKSYLEAEKKSVTKMAYSSPNLVIPEGTTEIRDKEFENRKDIVSVSIPKGVIRIGKQAFAGCTNLKTVTFSGNLKITCDAFMNCNMLNRESLQKIAENIEGMYSKVFLDSNYNYATPCDDPNYDISGEGLDPNKYIYELRRAQNGVFYTVCFQLF